MLRIFSADTRLENMFLRDYHRRGRVSFYSSSSSLVLLSFSSSSTSSGVFVAAAGGAGGGAGVKNSSRVPAASECDSFLPMRYRTTLAKRGSTFPLPSPRQ